MLSVAFTLGLFGSMHCIGMCGALSCALCKGSEVSRNKLVLNALLYQLGRVLTYMILGVLFGLVSQLLLIAELQKYISILIGVVLVLSVLTSINLEYHLNNVPMMQGYLLSIRYKLASIYNATYQRPKLILGMINGLLPCGMVYLALAGALTTGGMMDSVLFMAAFGLGTIPLMALFTVGVSSLPGRIRGFFQRALPAITFLFGVYMILRGLGIHMPEELDFWHAMQHPVMCFTSQS